MKIINKNANASPEQIFNALEIVGSLPNKATVCMMLAFGYGILNTDLGGRKMVHITV